MSDGSRPDINALTVQLLSAYVSNNTVASEDLLQLIRSTRTALEAPVGSDALPQPEHVPAVSLRKSLASPDHILSLIDGKPYKTLKRHLATHGLTPDDYRDRYGLPKSYPMVAPNYSERRRAVARDVGLGRKRTDAEQEVSAPAPAPEIPAKPKPKASGAAKASAARTKPAVSKAAAPAPAAPQAEPAKAANGKARQSKASKPTGKAKLAAKPASARKAVAAKGAADSESN